MANIHIVDMGKIGLDASDPSAEDFLSVGRAIVTAFRSSGFVYLRSHGISQQLQGDTFSVAKSFFQLEDHQKMAHERFKTGYNGYTPIGGEYTAKSYDTNTNLTDYKEHYDIHVIGQDYPDSACPELGPQLELLGSSCIRLSERLLAALDAELGSGQLLTSCHQRQLQHPGGWSAMRVLHYPPMPEGLPAATVRCGEHTDFGTVTLLFQDDVGGLEVLTSEGSWEAAAPVPGTILVNIGDMMELWTAGQLRATKHRVTVPLLGRATARQSIVFFVNPDDKTIVAPLSGDPRYQPVDAGDFVRSQVTKTYPKFSEMKKK